jgi:hypothetical protein
VKCATLGEFGAEVSEVGESEALPGYRISGSAHARMASRLVCSHRQRFRSGGRLVDQDSQGYEFSACGAGVTNVSLPILQVEVQGRRIQMIDPKAASN